jgi:Protein of unknown function (DUF3443)
LRNLFVSLMFASLVLAGCGGGGGTTTSSSGSSGSGTTSTGYNVVNATVDQGPSGLTAAGYAAVNIMYVNVTICVPGSTTNCQTIDHVQVDTGSQGLRILASVVNSSLLSALSPVTVNGGALAECTQFVDGYSWGPIVTADMHIGGSDTATTGETAASLPVQLIGSGSYAVPADCSNGSVNTTSEDTVASFGANGIIGIGLFDEDCGTGCDTTIGVTNGNGYFSCTSSSSCTETLVPVANQMINPVYGLAANSSGVTDNNGVIIELPAVGATGAATVTGTLVFGIGTQTNNALSSSATILTTDSYYGYVSVNFIGSNFPDSYLDSGSNAFYFNDSSITACGSSSVAPGFFCPASTVSLSATVTGNNGAQSSPSFSVASAVNLFNDYPTYAAFSNLAGSAGTDGASSFAFGLPFFYGRNVYTAMENTNAGGTNGPYFAF